MHIRPAKIEDLPSLIQLGKHLLELHSEFDYDYYQLTENFDELFGSWIKNQLNQPNQFILVAQTQDIPVKIIGFISGFLKSLYPWFRTKTVGHISYLVVDKESRQKGIGKLLEEEARNWFKSKNISYIEVYVDEKNSPGSLAWSEYGFLPFKKFLRKKI